MKNNQIVISKADWEEFYEGTLCFDNPLWEKFYNEINEVLSEMFSETTARFISENITSDVAENLKNDGIAESYTDEELRAAIEDVLVECTAATI